MPIRLSLGWEYTDLEKARQRKLLEQIKDLAIKEGFDIQAGRSFGDSAIRFVAPRGTAKKESVPLMFLFRESGTIGLMFSTALKRATKKYECVRFALHHRLAFGNQKEWMEPTEAQLVQMRKTYPDEYFSAHPY